MYRKKYHIHFVGIGGIGMSGIAELLLNLGYTVSGSDLKSSEITERLKRFGGHILKGHAEDQVGDADVVVVSSAVDADNPEVRAARQASIPVIPRAEMLAELMRLKYSIAVAGAHGKTTTTSIVSAVLDRGGLDPTVVIGGKLKSIGTNARLGEGEFIVAEADESDGSFLKMSPTIAVVTNIDREHLDHYPDLDAIKSAFLDFIDRIPFYGLAVLCLDNESVQSLIPEIKKRYTTYGMSTQADVQARNVIFEGLRSRFTLCHKGEPLGDIRLNLPGIHNVYSRTRALFDEFTRSFYQSDVLLVLPIYSAGEKVIEGVDSSSMCDGIRQHGHKEVICKDTIAAAVAGLKNILVPGDILLTLGAGDVWKVGEEVLRELGPRRLEK
jgi:UDP-N-acetylmuramate--alanine ligase